MFENPPVLPGNTTISRLCWDMVRQRHGIEEQHHVLHVPTPDITQNEYLAAQPRLFDELQRVGLTQGTTIHSGLVAAMRLLTRPPVELHGWVGYHNRVTIGVVAASDGHHHAVLAILDDAALHLRPIQPDKLAEAVVDLLPPLAPARGHSLTVPLDAYQNMVNGNPGTVSEEDGWLERNTPAGRLDGELRSLYRLLSQPRLGGGRIYAAARDNLGRRCKSQYPLTYLDTESGRWTVQQKPGDTGEPWVVAVPATQASLIGRLNDLIRTVLAGR